MKDIETITYTKAPLIRDDIGDLPYRSFVESIINAEQEALRQGIKANSVLINANMVKVPEFLMLYGEHSYKAIPPMICGLNMYLTKNDLPDGYSFAVFQGPNNRLAQFESIGMEPDELRKAAEVYRAIKEKMEE